MSVPRCRDVLSESSVSGGFKQDTNETFGDFPRAFAAVAPVTPIHQPGVGSQHGSFASHKMLIFNGEWSREEVEYSAIIVLSSLKSAFEQSVWVPLL